MRKCVNDSRRTNNAKTPISRLFSRHHSRPPPKALGSGRTQISTETPAGDCGANWWAGFGAVACLGAGSVETEALEPCKPSVPERKKRVSLTPEKDVLHWFVQCFPGRGQSAFE